MSEKENLAEIEKAAEWFKNRAKATLMPGACRMFELAEKALREKANGVTVQEWISVGERLPDPNKTVLVCKTFVDKPYIDIGYVKDAETCCCASDGYMIKPWLHKLTHWMPLPEPPKGE